MEAYTSLNLAKASSSVTQVECMDANTGPSDVDTQCGHSNPALPPQYSSAWRQREQLRLLVKGYYRKPFGNL